jgi:hypothetical protein
LSQLPPPRLAISLPHPNIPDAFLVVLVTLNAHGQPPALLIDPVAVDGTVVAGTWLGASEDGTASAVTYQQLSEGRAVGASQTLSHDAPLRRERRVRERSFSPS